MKQKLFLAALLVLSQLLTFKMAAFSQDRDKCPSVINSVKQQELIGDETTIQETKSGMTIKSASKLIVDKLLSEFEPEIKKVLWKWDKERRGEKEYVIYVTKELGNKIKEWAKINL